MSNPFRPVYRQLAEGEQELVEQIKDVAYAFYLELQKAGHYNRAADPAVSRHIALAKTALEEAVMWATKAVTS